MGRPDALRDRPRDGGAEHGQAGGAPDREEEHGIDPRGGRRDQRQWPQAATAEQDAVAGISQRRDERRGDDDGELRSADPGRPLVTESDQRAACHGRRQQGAPGQEHDGVREQGAAHLDPAGDENGRRLRDPQPRQAGGHERGHRDEGDRPAAGRPKRTSEDQHRDEEARVACDLRPEEERRAARHRVRLAVALQHAEALFWLRSSWLNLDTARLPSS